MRHGRYTVAAAGVWRFSEQTLRQKP